MADVAAHAKRARAPSSGRRMPTSIPPRRVLDPRTPDRWTVTLIPSGPGHQSVSQSESKVDR